MTMWDGETYSVAGQAIVGFRCIKDKNKEL